jgi:hypothetical protein
MRSILTVLLLCLSLPMAAKQLIAFEANAIAAPVVPGGKAVIFGLAREARADHVRIIDYARILEDDDRDGIVRLPLERPAPRESLWLVVDLTTGESTIVAPPGARLLRKPLPPSALMARGNSRAARALHLDQHVLFWLIRPGTGAWASMIDDGSPADGDAAYDGHASVLLDELQPIGISPPAPPELRGGDIFAIVVPDTLEIFDTKVVQ